MKRTMITVVSWSLIISAIAMVYFFNFIDRKEELLVEVMSKDIQSVSKMEEHIGLAEEALREFGAESGEKAANLWAKGVMTRNGVLQYAVMNKELQQEFKEHLINKNNSSWVTGNSSPWITDYEIVDQTEVSGKVKLYKVKFEVATAKGKEKSAYNTLTIMCNNNKWSISSIR
ncbi:MAG: hypothetical protein ACLSV2_10310 [Clostridium sp.]